MIPGTGCGDACAPGARYYVSIIMLKCNVFLMEAYFKIFIQRDTYII